VTFGIEYQSVLAQRHQLKTEVPGHAAVAAVYDRRNPRLSFLSDWIKSLKNALSRSLRQIKVP